jgi:hypothetical protein
VSEATVKNATIEYAKISCDDGFLSVWVGLDYGDCGCQGFGGFVCYLPKSYMHHKLESVAGHFIYRVMEVAGVTEWSALKGRTVRARSHHSAVEAIGHITKKDWFCPEEDFKVLREEEPCPKTE